MSRAELREHIFRMLFRIEFNDASEMKEQEEFYFEELPQASEAEAEETAAVLRRLYRDDEADQWSLADVRFQNRYLRSGRR